MSTKDEKKLCLIYGEIKNIGSFKGYQKQLKPRLEKTVWSQEVRV